MVNDLLRELYLKVRVLHLVWLLEARLTIDSIQVSIRWISRRKSPMAVWLDQLKRRVLRAFQRISPGIAGLPTTVFRSPVGPQGSSYLWELRAGAFHQAPSLSKPPPKRCFSRHFRHRSPLTRIRQCRRSIARPRRHFESGGAAVRYIKHACNCSIFDAFLICTKPLETRPLKARWRSH